VERKGAFVLLAAFVAAASVGASTVVAAGSYLQGTVAVGFRLFDFQ